MDEQVKLFTHMKYNLELIKKCIMESQVLDIIKPSDTVVLKPNFVQETRDRDLEWEFVITHPCVITAVIQLLIPILKEKGKIIIADAPMTASSFEKIMAHMPVKKWEEECKNNGVKFEIIDLRDEEWVQSENHVTLERKKLKGDPNGKVLFNLKDETSEFFGKITKETKLYGADYNIKETNQAHNGTDNFYSVSGTVIMADVFINLPKLKCHRKGGITCCLKNLIGINTNKNLLPHHTIGTPQSGGDEFSEDSRKNFAESISANTAKKIAYKMKFLSPLLIPLKKLAVKILGDNKKTVRNGAWYGNDTLWRTIIDLNKVMLYGNPDGSLRDECLQNRKRYIAIVDAVLGGEGDGPMDPDCIQSGWLICGNNPVSVDSLAARAMGFDYKKIPQICNSFKVDKYRIFDGSYEDIICSIDGNDGKKIEDIDWKEYPVWKASISWAGHIEI